MTKNKYTVGQTLYGAEFSIRSDNIAINRAVVEKVTPKTVVLQKHPDDTRSAYHGRYSLNAKSGRIARCRFYPPAHPTPTAALEALLFDTHEEEVSLLKKLRTARSRIELVAEKLEEENNTTER